MAGVPEGFIMPTVGTSLGGNVLKAVPSPEAVAGAVGTMVAEIVRHKEHNAKLTGELEKANLPGEGKDEIEIVLFHTDKYSKTPVRASCLSDPTRPFHCELTVEQQVLLAPMREKFRKNEHGSDTPIALWDAINTSERAKLGTLGLHYVEQIAAFKEHEYYKLGNGGADLVKKAQRHVSAKAPNKSEAIEQQMQTIMAERAREREEREALEKRMFEMQEQLAKLSDPRAGRGKTK